MAKKPGDILLAGILWLGMILFLSFLWAIPRSEMTGLTSFVMILSPLAVFVTGLLVLVRRTRHQAALPMLTP